MIYLDFTKRFIVTTDASKNALRAVLSQIGPDRREHPIAYTSCNTNPAEKIYNTMDLECLIGDQVLLHHTKAEKQWNEKFDPKWDGPFHIHKALGNGVYKLQLENRILKKVAHGNQLKIYHVKQQLSSLVH
ncbi:hypothetical protein G9A89_009304 [Geosiphon pyriformis]|nr:hypothetical protein G9A89_009304 [Geosiphon pyriformis]